MAGTIERPEIETIERSPANAADGFPPPGMPQRILVRSYSSFDAGVWAIERLVREEQIPRRRLTLVARGLKWVTYRDPTQLLATAAKMGALVGALACAVLYVLGLAQANLSLFLPAVIGALSGMVAGFAIAAISHWRTGAAPRGMPDGRLEVDHYDVMVDEEVAAHARAALVP